MHAADHTDALVHSSGPTCINKHVGYHSAARDVNEHRYIPARAHKTTHFNSVLNVGVRKNYNARDSTGTEITRKTSPRRTKTQPLDTVD